MVAPGNRLCETLSGLYFIVISGLWVGQFGTVTLVNSGLRVGQFGTVTLDNLGPLCPKFS